MISAPRQTGNALPDVADLHCALDRNEMFAGLFIVGYANGIVVRIANEIAYHELADLLMNTFEISAIVWISLIVGIWFLLQQPRASVTKVDQVVAAVVILAVVAPWAQLSWIAMSGLAIYIVRTSTRGSYLHHAGWLLLAVTVPMFWSRLAFALFSQYILEVDAILSAWMVGTERAGNAIAFSDGSGYLWIAPGCSSISNLSLTILCWVLFAQLFYGEPVLPQAWRAVLACIAVLAINVTRLSLIALYREHFDLLHGPVGATTANWLTFAAIISICAIGVQRDLATNVETL